MSLHVKKGDNVVVIAGKDKKKTGNIISANPSDNTVVVSGVNMIAKHQKPKKAGEKGGIIKREGKIDASNVQVICPACKKATRIANKEVDGKKVRVCKHCGASLDKAVTIKKETKKADKKVVEAVKAEKPAKKRAPKKTASATKTAKTTTTKKTTTTTKTKTTSTTTRF